MKVESIRPQSKPPIEREDIILINYTFYGINSTSKYTQLLFILNFNSSKTNVER